MQIQEDLPNQIGGYDDRWYSPKKRFGSQVE